MSGLTSGSRSAEDPSNSRCRMWRYGVALEPSRPIVADAGAVLGEFAALLVDATSVVKALDSLASGLGLRSAVVRSVTGELLGVGGESLRAVTPVRVLRSEDSWLEFTVAGRGGLPAATLTVQGARPSQVSALKAAAAVLGLALSQRVDGHVLLDDGEAGLEGLADALHDGALQSALVARYAADVALRGGDGGEVVLARDAVQQSVLELRRRIWQIRPRGGAGLGDALRQLSERLVEAGEPALCLELADDSDLTGRAGVLAYRFVQGAARVTPALTVRVGSAGPEVSVEIDAPVPGASWDRKAAALGGRLQQSNGRPCLVLPRSNGDAPASYVVSPRQSTHEANR